MNQIRGGPHARQVSCYSKAPSDGNECKTFRIGCPVPHAARSSVSNLKSPAPYVTDSSRVRQRRAIETI